MVDFLKSIDDKTNLAGTNRLELIMFTLRDKGIDSQSSFYGLNVFKVRELITLPELIKNPNRHKCCPGIANVRGKAVPVIDLQKYYGYPTSEQNILIITEFNGQTQGFVVDEVEEIIQLDWQNIIEPPDIVNNGNTLTGISLLSDDSMLMIIDVEQVIAEVLGSGIDTIAATNMTKRNTNQTVLFADDSRVARIQVASILSKMGLKYYSAKNGQEALDILDAMARDAEPTGRPLSDTLSAILTDVEMPVMDGYMLTRKVKEDRRFDGIPVMMHSSLSAEENIRLGEKVGVDAYVPKLRPKEFSIALDKLINPENKKAA